MNIRPARPDDGPALRALELAAGEQFRDIGMGDIADHDPPSLDTFARYAREGRSWVAADEDDGPIGFVLVDEVDDAAHIEQVSVHPYWQGHGVGRALIDQAEAFAVANRTSSLTLTTFADVPWNRPLYEHLGFVVLAEDELTPELRALRDDETAHGLDPATRVCMRRPVA